MVLTLENRRFGDGPWPLVLLHGFTGSRDSFAHLEPHLGARARVTVLELPGHGQSAAPPRAAWDGTVASIAAALAAHDGPVHLAGYSLGARLALAVALRHPLLVRSLTLESGAAGLRTEPERSARRAADEALAVLLEREGVAAFVAHWERQPVLAGLSRLAPGSQEELRALRLRASPQGLAWALRALGQGTQPSLWDELPGLRVPTLVVHGALDLRFAALGEALARGLPSAVVRAIAGAGHTPHLEQPARFAAALADHLAQCSSPSRSPA